MVEEVEPDPREGIPACVRGREGQQEVSPIPLKAPILDPTTTRVHRTQLKRKPLLVWASRLRLAFHSEECGAGLLTSVSRLPVALSLNSKGLRLAGWVSSPESEQEAAPDLRSISTRGRVGKSVWRQSPSRELDWAQAAADRWRSTGGPRWGRPLQGLDLGHTLELERNLLNSGRLGSLVRFVA